MKSIILIITVLLFISCKKSKVHSELFLDNLTTKQINSTLYRNIPNEIAFSLQPKYRGIISPINIEIKKNYDCFCKLEITGYETIRITPTDSTIYVGLEYIMNEEIIGGDFYRIKNPHKPKLYSYEISNMPETGLFDDNLVGSYHSVNEIKKLKKFELRFDYGTGTNSISFDINSFQYLIIRNKEIIASGINQTGLLNSGTKKNFKTVVVEDIIQITDIEYSLKNNSKKQMFNYEAIRVK